MLAKSRLHDSDCENSQHGGTQTAATNLHCVSLVEKSAFSNVCRRPCALKGAARVNSWSAYTDSKRIYIYIHAFSWCTFSPCDSQWRPWSLRVLTRQRERLNLGWTWARQRGEQKREELCCCFFFLSDDPRSFRCWGFFKFNTIFMGLILPHPYQYAFWFVFFFFFSKWQDTWLLMSLLQKNECHKMFRKFVNVLKFTNIHCWVMCKYWSAAERAVKWPEKRKTFATAAWSQQVSKDFAQFPVRLNGIQIMVNMFPSQDKKKKTWKCFQEVGNICRIMSPRVTPVLSYSHIFFQSYGRKHKRSPICSRHRTLWAFAV